MKSLVLAAVLGLAAPALLPAMAQAQVAAGSVPNSFDAPARPAAAQAAPAPTPAPRPAAVPAMTTPANPQSEEVLRTVIANAQSGTFDYSLMEDSLVARVRQQEAQILPLIRGFGAVQAVDFVGSQDGADMFIVVFANAPTQWVIGFNDAGKIDALLFRPAEAAGQPAPRPAN